MEQKGKIGFLACLTILIGGCIGSAIFSLAGMTMYYAGPAAIISWAIAGIILMGYGMLVAELAMRYPQSGGTFVFPNKAFKKTGAFWGFMSSWGYGVSNIICVAFSAIYIATYLGAGFPALSNLQIPLAIAACVLVIVLNLVKLTDLGVFQDIIVIALIISMIIYICVACFGGTFTGANFTPFFTQGIKGGTGWISAIPITSVAYGACVGISFMVSEVKDPQKNIPKSLVVGLIICIIVYCLMMIATVGNLNTAILLDDNNAFFRYVPMFAAIWTSALGQYAWLAQLVSLSALFALLTTMLAVSAINVRGLQATASNGYLPKWMASMNKNGVPLGATLVTGAIAIFLSCFPAWTEVLVNLGCLFAVATIVITVASLIASRKQFDLPAGTYKAPLGAFLPWFVIVALVACYIPDILGGGWQLWAFTVAIYAIGAIIYFIYKGKREKAGAAQEAKAE